MLSLLILLVVVLVIGYFLGRGKTGERLENWFRGLRAPREAEPAETEAEGDEEA